MPLQVPLSLLICLCLQGCFWTAYNTEEASAPFPEVPSQPDGVCPDLTGTYPYFTKEERNNDADLKKDGSLKWAIFGKFFSTTETEKLEKIHPTNLPPLTERMISFKTIKPDTLRISSILTTGKVYSIIFIEYTPETRVCDKGKIYLSENFISEGSIESPASITYKLIIVSKDPNGDIISKEYRHVQTRTLYGLLPGWKGRYITKYRFKKISDKPIEFSLPE